MICFLERLFLFSFEPVSTLMMAYSKDQKIHLEIMYPLTLLESQCIPLGGLCRIDSRSALSSSSERLTMVVSAMVVAFFLDFPLGAFPLVWGF
jgi:hypothetical protein